MKNIHTLLNLPGLTPGKLVKAAGLSWATMSRVMNGHIPADDTLNRIAAVLEVAPGYLRGGYTLPKHLNEDDILLLADLRNVPYTKMVLLSVVTTESGMVSQMLTPGRMEKGIIFRFLKGIGKKCRKVYVGRSEY